MDRISLSDAQLDRYARHLILKEIGGAGQAALLGGHVALVGAGGIGAPAIQYLAGAGVGTLTLIDDDVVSLSNLQRQTLYGMGDLDRPKVTAAAAAIARLNPDVRVIARQTRLDAGNAPALLAEAAVVIDGCDNFATRLIVADAALRLRKPLVSAAVGQFEGQLAVFRGWEADLPCYRCFVGDDPAVAGTSCAEEGVLGAMTGLLGSLAALEAVRLLTGFGGDTAGRLLLIDALDLRFRSLRLPKDPGCAACG